MEGVTQRIARILGLSALLGLPAAVLAHWAIFGHAHILGGNSHALLSALWIICVGLAIAGALAAAFLSTRSQSSISRAIGRIGLVAPSLAALLASTTFWFVMIELREKPHAIPTLSAIAAICFAAWIVGALWRGLARAAAAVATEWFQRLRIACESGSPSAWGTPVPVIAAHAPAYRLFSRPPPA